MREGEWRCQAGGWRMLCQEGRWWGCPWHRVPSPGVGSMPVGRRSPRLWCGPGERWARLRRAPRPVPTLLCAGLGLRGPSVDLLSRPPGWLGGNPWGKGAGQRVSASGRGKDPLGGGGRGSQELGWWVPCSSRATAPSRGAGGVPGCCKLGSSRRVSRKDPAISNRTGVPWHRAGGVAEAAVRSQPGCAHAQGDNAGTCHPADSAPCREARPWC